MPEYSQFTLAKFEDGLLTIYLTPPVEVGGWSTKFSVTKRPGGTTDLIAGYTASGYNGVSGITVTSSGEGVYSVDVPGRITSGMDVGLYHYRLERLDSGNRTILSDGFFLLNP